MAEKKNDYFGRHLKAGISSISYLEGVVNKIIEDELMEQFGLTGDSMQKYKAGNIPANTNLIRAIAINCVKRGQMGLQWLNQFLDAADYPATYALVEELFPAKIDTKKKEKLNDNLPAPSYSKFVMRIAEFEKIIDGLQNRSAVVLLRSLGGMGKTSLAREIASQCISFEKEYASIPIKFETAIWVSDANNPGTTNMTVVMDAIAHTLDFNEIVKLPIDEKINAVTRILSRHKILLIIDNFETINDDHLLKWVTSLPEPSKCIITTREYHRAFRNNTRDIELGGLNINEAHDFIKNKMIDLGISQTKNRIQDFDPLITTCGGNPKAIEMALGIIKHDGRTLKTTLEELTSIKGELFRDLFKRAWGLLNDDAKNILMIMAMFPSGTKEEPISKILSINDNDFQNAIAKLIDLSLINIKEEGISIAPFYYLHPLVNSFAIQKLKESESFEKTMRSNWLKYYLELSNEVGFCWNDIEKLKILDEDGLKEGVEYAIDWANKNQHFDYVIDISENVKYYFYIRGIWSSQLNILRANVAKLLSKSQAEFDALVYHLNILCKQGNIEEAEIYIPILNDLKTKNQFSNFSLIDYNHSVALYHLLKEEYDIAIELWEANLVNKVIDQHQLNANKRWLGICLYKKGDWEASKRILKELADDQQDEKLLHSALSANIYLAKIDFKENLPDKALPRIMASLDLAKKNKEEAFIPEFELLYGQYSVIKENYSGAKDYFESSIARFEKLGRNDKVNETTIQLNQIINKL